MAILISARHACRLHIINVQCNFRAVVATLGMLRRGCQPGQLLDNSKSTSACDSETVLLGEQLRSVPSFVARDS